MIFFFLTNKGDTNGLPSDTEPSRARETAPALGQRPGPHAQVLRLRPAILPLLKVPRRMGRLLALPSGRAEGLLVESGWDLPVALAAGRWGLPAARAREWIASRRGNVARALEEEPT